MDAPPVQYVRTSDDVSIAYSICGNETPLVVVPPTFHHLQLIWEQEPHAGWYANLATKHKLVLHDHRGTGLSERGLSGFKPTDRVLDLEAVVDRACSGRFALLALGSACHPAVRFAAQHPHRVGALILISCSVTMEPWAPAVFERLANEDWEAFLYLVSRSPSGLAVTSNIVEARKRTVTQSDFVTLTRASSSSSIDDVLPDVSPPTIVIHPREVRAPSHEDCAEVASMMPHARLIEVEGGSDVHIGAYNDSTIAAIEGFLADLPPFDQRVTPDSGNSALSSREIQVLQLLAAGKSNLQIADELVISLNTVRRHVSNVLDKTGAANRAQAGAWARDHDLA